MNKRKKRLLVSVVMPVYNPGKFLGPAIESILNQTYRNLELICVDDGSTDGSFEVLKKYEKRDKRVRVYKNRKNMGIGYTANKLSKLTKGDFVARMDADDIAFPERIEKQVEFLTDNPKVVVVGGQCEVIDELGKVVGEKIFPIEQQYVYWQMFCSMAYQQPTMMVNKKLLPKNYVWYQNKYHPCDDLDFAFRAFKYGKVVNLADYVLQYRVWGKSSSLRNPKTSYFKTLRIRLKAVREGYKPTWFGVLVNMAQLMSVVVLPSVLVIPVYKLYKKIGGVDLSGKSGVKAISGKVAVVRA